MSRYIISLRDYRFCVFCLFICIYFIVCKASKKRNWMWDFVSMKSCKAFIIYVKKNFPLIFWWINYIFLVSVMFQNKIATTYPSIVLGFFFRWWIIDQRGRGCVLNMYFNDICLLLFFFFTLSQNSCGWRGGGNNFLLIYIYILENSCEGWGKPSYPPPLSPSPMPCALISDSHIGHIYTQHTKT